MPEEAADQGTAGLDDSGSSSVARGTEGTRADTDESGPRSGREDAQSTDRIDDALTQRCWYVPGGSLVCAQPSEELLRPADPYSIDPDRERLKTERLLEQAALRQIEDWIGDLSREKRYGELGSKMLNAIGALCDWASPEIDIGGDKPTGPVLGTQAQMDSATAANEITALSEQRFSWGEESRRSFAVATAIWALLP